MTVRNDDQDDQWRRLRVDRRATTPLYQQIANTIRHRIATNEVSAMSRVPSVRTMARFADVTPATIARAYQVLQSEGLIETVSGSGTVIADARNIENEARTRSQEALARAVDQAVTPLLDMHFTPEEVLEAVRRRLLEATPHELVVVAAARPVAEKYARILREKLNERYRIVPVLVSQIRSADADAVAAVRRADRCVTLLSLHQVVRDLLAPYDVPLSLILTQLSLDTLHQLETLSSEGSLEVGVVAEEYYRPSVVATLGQYFALDRITVASSLDPPDIQRQLAAVELCIHTLGVQETMAHVRLEHARSLELKFEVRQDSLERFLTFLAED